MCSIISLHLSLILSPSLFFSNYMSSPSVYPSLSLSVSLVYSFSVSLSLYLCLFLSVSLFLSSSLPFCLCLSHFFLSFFKSQFQILIIVCSPVSFVILMFYKCLWGCVSLFGFGLVAVCQMLVCFIYLSVFNLTVAPHCIVLTLRLRFGAEGPNLKGLDRHGRWWTDFLVWNLVSTALKTMAHNMTDIFKCHHSEVNQMRLHSSG